MPSAVFFTATSVPLSCHLLLKTWLLALCLMLLLCPGRRCTMGRGAMCRHSYRPPSGTRIFTVTWKGDGKTLNSLLSQLQLNLSKHCILANTKGLYVLPLQWNRELCSSLLHLSLQWRVRKCHMKVFDYGINQRELWAFDPNLQNTLRGMWVSHNVKQQEGQIIYLCVCSLTYVHETVRKVS